MDTNRTEVEHDGLTLAERNVARIQALNSIGVGVGNVQGAFFQRCLEFLLSPAELQRLSDEHELMVAEQLDEMEAKVIAAQQEQMAKTRLWKPGNGNAP